MAPRRKLGVAAAAGATAVAIVVALFGDVPYNSHRFERAISNASG